MQPKNNRTDTFETDINLFFMITNCRVSRSSPWTNQLKQRDGFLDQSRTMYAHLLCSDLMEDVCVIGHVVLGSWREEFSCIPFGCQWRADQLFAKAGYLFADIICSEKGTVFRERGSRKTESFEEQQEPITWSVQLPICIFTDQSIFRLFCSQNRSLPVYVSTNR